MHKKNNITSSSPGLVASLGIVNCLINTDDVLFVGCLRYPSACSYSWIDAASSPKPLVCIISYKLCGWVTVSIG